MKPNPSISVVIPLYNKAAYVREAIDSVLEQMLPALEIIVVDDGSTDGGADIVRNHSSPAVRLIGQENAGVSQARNRGVAAAKGDYIAFLDADDRYQSGFLAGIGRLIQRFPLAAVYCTGYACFWDDGTRAIRWIKSLAAGESSLIRDFYREWCKGSFTSTSAIVVRRSLFDDPDLRFPVGEKLGEDQDLWFRVAERGDFAYLNAPLVEYRMGVVGSATQANSVLDVLPCYRRLGERLDQGVVPGHLCGGGRRLLASHFLNLARSHLLRGDLAKAWGLLADRRARANKPYFLRTLLVFVGAALTKRRAV